MESWPSYALSDFLLFSPESYYRRFELANSELWPLQLLLLAAAASLLWSLMHPRPRSTTWITLVLATFWALAGLLFLHRHYAQINPLVDWFALAFLLQGIFFMACHLSEIWRIRFFDLGPVKWSRPGMLLCVYATMIHPLAGIITGRGWQSLEVVGIAPDATALVTVGLLLCGRLLKNWMLLILPFGWLVFSALTYLAMEQPVGLLPIILALITLLAQLLAGRFRRPESA